MKLKMYKVVVHVKRLVPRKQLGELDQNMAGRYKTETEASRKKEAKEFALDWFHNNFAIDNLPDFEIWAEVKKIKI